MSVIPFALVGAIWGHAVWGLPMSMFTVVGLIGMVGIIINDSIVLVTTIDEYAATRGPRVAIVDAAVDRLRAVFLTTATTVLGLAPLMFEGSSQAEFLKPTVVTLVFGLGFGMVLVLMVVPALVAVQQDGARLWLATRRAFATAQGGLRGTMALGSGAALVALAAFIVPVVMTGAPWPALAALIPALTAGAAPAFGLFALTLAVLLGVIGAALALRRGRTRAAG